MLITLKDNHFELMADRAVFWKEQKLLMVADLHFAKDSIFRQQGVPIPAGTDQDTFARLDRLIAERDCEKLLMLGDFIHGKLTAEHRFYGQYQQWRKNYQSLQCSLTLGNHDRHIETELLTNTDCIDHLVMGDFLFCHEQQELHEKKDAEGFAFAGHIHPAYRLRSGKQTLRLPVFWLQPKALILPAFSRFTGSYSIEPDNDDRCFACLEDKVMELPVNAPLKKAK